MSEDVGQTNTPPADAVFSVFTVVAADVCPATDVTAAQALLAAFSALIPPANPFAGQPVKARIYDFIAKRSAGVTTDELVPDAEATEDAA
jgi:hypothetical protein